MAVQPSEKLQKNDALKSCLFVVFFWFDRLGVRWWNLVTMNTISPDENRQGLQQTP
jgi:hypothetical protein